jgi:hypothetical protein
MDLLWILEDPGSAKLGDDKAESRFGSNFWILSSVLAAPGDFAVAAMG